MTTKTKYANIIILGVLCLRNYGGCFMATKKRTSKTGRKSNTRGKARNNRPSAAEVQKVEEFRLEVFLWIVFSAK